MAILSKPLWDLENVSVQNNETPENTLAKVVEALKAFGCTVEENSIYAIVAHRLRVNREFEIVLKESDLVDYVYLKEALSDMNIPKQESDREIHKKMMYYIGWGNAFRDKLPWPIPLPPPTSIAVVVIAGDKGYATYMKRLKELGYIVLLIYPRYRTNEEVVFASTQAVVYEDLFLGPAMWTSPENHSPSNYSRKSINPKLLNLGNRLPPGGGNGGGGTGGSGGSGSVSRSGSGTDSRSGSKTGSRSGSGTGSRNTSGTSSRNRSGTTGWRRAGQYLANMKHEEKLLEELALRWSNHKCLIRWLSRGFSYIDRYYVMRRSLPTLNQVGMTCFHDLVYKEMQPRATEAVIALIHKEREGEEIDRALLKNILDMYVEMGMGQMDKYEDDFESSMLQDIESYYSSKASSWIKEDSCPQYMLKAEECLEKERERVTHYLRKSTEPKLLEKVENELLVVVAKQLIENEHSGCRALLRDGEMNDLSRMYHKFPQGLDAVAEFDKQVVECLKKERERVTHYLHINTEPKLLAKVEKELLVVVAKQLIENEHSGCRALLRDTEVLFEKPNELYGDCVGFKTKAKFFNEAMDKPLKIFNNMPLAGF